MTTYYVAKTGSNSGTGSASSPWLTIGKAMQADLNPGDTVIVKSGTYNEQVRISASGSAAGYITVKSEVPGGAKIVPPSDKTYGVHIQGDYVTLDGFEISQASGAGVTAHMVNHVKILNNIVHDNGTHGISASLSDFITIQGNTTYDNASKGFYSGISVYHPVAVAGDDSTYRIIIRDNISYSNITKASNAPHSDGNGIILDDFRSTKSASLGAYTHKTLVENNLVYDNGGKGIQVAWTDYATIRNNTAWHNGQDNQNKGTWRGDLSNVSSSHNTWVNNISVADLSTNSSNRAIDNVSYAGYTNTDNVWSNNLTWSGTAGDASVRTTGDNEKLSESDGNLLGVNPHLVNPKSNFSLDSDSPAIDAGTKVYGYVSTDLEGQSRSGAVDLGALESSGSSSGDSDEDDASSDSDSGVERHGGSGNNTLTGGSGADKLYGGDGADTLSGGAGNDKLYGENSNDKLYGEAGNDTLTGGNGVDKLYGGTGKDVLVGGGSADTFVFRTVSEAGKGSSADTISDFSHSKGDKIDLSGIDANTKVSGDQAFSYIGSSGFSGKAGQLKYSDGTISGDVNGDKVADFNLEITNHHALVASDFLF